MSTFQDLEKIRNEIGEEKYAAIERYLKQHPELALTDIYYKKEEWERFEAWFVDEKLDKEYLAKPIIEGAAFHINETKVQIAHPTTYYVSEKRVELLEYPLPLYTEVLRLAKSKGIKISYNNHYRTQIVEGWEQYRAAHAETEALFVQIVEQSKVVEARGLHYGVVDDLELRRLTSLCQKRQELFYGGGIISKYTNIVENLRTLEYQLADPNCAMNLISL